MPVYISSLIIVSAFFMFVQSIFFIAYRKYKTLLLLLVHACTYCLPYNTPILKSLHWLPVKYCINFKLCCITHRTLSLGELHYLNSLLILRLNCHSFCSFSFYPLLSLFFNKMSMVSALLLILHHFFGTMYLILFILHLRTCLLKKTSKHIFNHAFST